MRSAGWYQHTDYEAGRFWGKKIHTGLGVAMAHDQIPVIAAHVSIVFSCDTRNSGSYSFGTQERAIKHLMEAHGMTEERAANMIAFASFKAIAKLIEGVPTPKNIIGEVS
jgi:hypothetical protein